MGNADLPENRATLTGRGARGSKSLILRKTLRTPRVSVHNTFAHNDLTEVAVLFELLLPGAFVDQPCATSEKGMLRVGYAYLGNLQIQSLLCSPEMRLTPPRRARRRIDCFEMPCKLSRSTYTKNTQKEV